jgi:hypothetical protein
MANSRYDQYGNDQDGRGQPWGQQQSGQFGQGRGNPGGYGGQGGREQSWNDR